MIDLSPRVLEFHKTARTADVPPWMSRLDYSGLKIQLMGSIIAISAITTLRVFIELNNGAMVDEKRLMWTTIIFVVFLFAALIMAVINRLKHPHQHESGSVSPGTE
jgi:uncharacterized protein (TIGR00645 family)